MQNLVSRISAWLSRFKENAETEKASLFHLNRENKNFQKNNHSELKIDGEITKEKDKIEKEVLTYYGRFSMVTTIKI